MKLTESDLVSIIKAHRSDSLGSAGGELSAERASALDHYHGRAYGNEQEGRSAVVSRDLSETVDWAMPAIMRIFTQSGNLAEFDPVGPEDERLAEQESDYTNQVIMRDNNGFIVLHDAIKDTLLLKNGYVKHYWEETEKVKTEEYSGLTIEDLTRLMSDLQYDGSEVEIKGQEERLIDIGGQMVPVFDIELQVKCKTGKVVVEAVPTEEIRVSRRCRGSLQTSPFTEHVTIKTRSELVEMGMGKDFVYSLPAWDGNDNDSEVLARDSVTDESGNGGSTATDRSMDEIEYCEAYLKVDWDGDGLAELRKIVTVSDKIPPGKEWNEPISAVPITGFTAKRMAHRHVGESLDDDLADLQEINTTLFRQLLDNIYLTNNQQYAVNERVNLADFMQSVPGGVKRIKGLDPVNGSYEPIMAAPIVGQILPVIDFVNVVKENRTGISRSSTGLDPDVLKQATKGAFLENLNRASQKIEMITRMLAETGVKEMVLQVHSLLNRHQDKPRVVQMRGTWETINPQEWRERTDLTVRVGLGTGNEEDKRQRLLLIAQAQEKLAQLGLVGPKQAYNLFADLTETMGFDMPEKYAINPDSPEYKPPQSQSNALAEAEEVKGQFAMQREQMSNEFKMALEQMKQEGQSAAKMAQMMMDLANREADRRSKEAIETAKLEMQAMMGSLRVDLGMSGLGAGLQQQQQGNMYDAGTPQI